MRRLRETGDPILDGDIPHPQPDQARPEFWEKVGGRYVVNSALM
jgi:hypothetical protein